MANYEDGYKDTCKKFLAEPTRLLREFAKISTVDNKIFGANIVFVTGSIAFNLFH